MKKLLFLLLSISLMSTTCKEEVKSEKLDTTSSDFAAMLDSYYEDGLKLNPIMATFAGDNRYNDQFPNPLDPANIEITKKHFQSYKDQLAAIDESALNETELMTKAILEWECDINLEHMQFKNAEYFPIDQMWSINLMAGQMASGAGAPPFKTVEDSDNGLQRMDGYIAWKTSAAANMRTGMTEGYVLPKSLIAKVIPQ
jgi:uncharacterized protein (DUF885 family)